MAQKPHAAAQPICDDTQSDYTARSGSHDDCFDRKAGLRSQHELRSPVELRVEALGQHQWVELDATTKLGPHVCRQFA